MEDKKLFDDLLDFLESTKTDRCEHCVVTNVADCETCPDAIQIEGLVSRVQREIELGVPSVVCVY